MVINTNKFQTDSNLVISKLLFAKVWYSPLTSETSKQIRHKTNIELKCGIVVKLIHQI